MDNTINYGRLSIIGHQSIMWTPLHNMDTSLQYGHLTLIWTSLYNVDITL